MCTWCVKYIDFPTKCTNALISLQFYYIVIFDLSLTSNCKYFECKFICFLINIKYVRKLGSGGTVIST